MDTFLDSIRTEIYVNDDWLDISQFVINDTDSDWGIFGNTPTDKMASVGALKINLNNTNGEFTPNGTNLISGWDKGIPLRLVLTMDAKPFVKFKGRIGKINIPYTFEGIEVVPIVVYDWFDIAIRYPFNLAGIETNKTIDEAVQIVLDALPIQPDATSMDIGTDEMTSVFTSVKDKGTAYGELGKLALSEYAFIYLIKDAVYGETLKVENRSSRIGKSLSEIPIAKANAGRLLLQSGGYLLLQNGGKLILNQKKTPVIDFMTSSSGENGGNLINRIRVKNNPSRTDTSLNVLFSLASPIKIDAGETIKISITYKDPTGSGRRINGSNMQTPVITTDYLAYVNSNATGTNISANLSLITTFGSSGAEYEISNTGLTNGYITKLQARGYGVYFDDPIELTLYDTDSISAYGVSEFSIDQHYQSNLNISSTIANSILDQNKANKYVVSKINFLANLNEDSMFAFLYFDVGDLIRVVDTKHNVDQQFFIQSVKFTIKQGGIIYVMWGLVEALYANSFYWELEVEGKSEIEETTFISY